MLGCRVHENSHRKPLLLSCRRGQHSAFVRLFPKNYFLFFPNYIIIVEKMIVNRFPLRMTLRRRLRYEKAFRLDSIRIKKRKHTLYGGRRNACAGRFAGRLCNFFKFLLQKSAARKSAIVLSSEPSSVSSAVPPTDFIRFVSSSHPKRRSSSLSHDRLFITRGRQNTPTARWFCAFRPGSGCAGYEGTDDQALKKALGFMNTRSFRRGNSNFLHCRPS
jgi:hypothetical protein